MSLACSILKSAAIQLALSTKSLRGKKSHHDWLCGAHIGSRDAALSILQTHLNDCSNSVRKEIGETIRKHLNIGGGK